MLDFSVTFIITIFNIAVLFFVLRAILFKPVTKFMAERAKRVEDSIEQAAQDKAKAKKLIEQYEEKIKNAGAEAEEIIKTARKTARAEADMIIAGGKAAAQAAIVDSRKQMETEQEAAFAGFRLKLTALIMLASSRLVERDLSSDDNRRFANMLLDELSAQKGTK